MFIKLTDAITGLPIVLRKDLISKVFQNNSYKGEVQTVIEFTIKTSPEYVVESVSDVYQMLTMTY